VLNNGKATTTAAPVENNNAENASSEVNTRPSSIFGFAKPVETGADAVVVPAASSVAPASAEAAASPESLDADALKAKFGAKKKKKKKKSTDK
jgi:hypothetical protein